MSLSSLPLHLFFLPPQTHQWSIWAQLPQTHRRRPTLGRRPDPSQPLFSIFDVSACFSALCFELCLCFGFVFEVMFMFRTVLMFWVCVSSWVFVSGMGFGLAVLIFLLSFFVLLHWFWWAQQGCGCAVIFMGLLQCLYYFIVLKVKIAPLLWML